MEILTFVLAFLAFAAGIIAAPTDTSINVAYDNTYDDSSFSINSVACSDGPNGLGTKGYSTLGAVPGFPYIGAAPTVAGWDSPNCGACYSLSYNGVVIYVTAVDSSTGSFVVSQEALDKLTNNQAVFLGHVTASYAQVDASNCAAE